MPEKKPRELKALSGTDRPDRERGFPHPRPLIGNPPRGLPKEARKMWKEYASELESLGLASELDRPALERLCILHARLKALETELAEADLTVEGTHGTVKKDPRITIYLQLLREYREYLKAFGMMPAARQKLVTTPAKETEVDEFEAFLARGKEL